MLLDANGRKRTKGDAVKRTTKTTTAVAVLDAAVLLVLRRAPTAALRHLISGTTWSGSRPAVMDAGGVDGVAATFAAAGLWLVAAWVALGLVAVIGARLPGLAGRICGAASKALLPRIVRTALAGSAGLGVLCAAGTAGAVPSPGAQSSAQASATVAALRHPAHLRTADTGPGNQPVPAPAWPFTAPASSTSPVLTPTWPATGVADTRHVDDPAGTTTVRPGDSLWLIAERRLGAHGDTAHIAAAWPRWYAANRDVIGDDPNYIVAGQVLHPPAPATRQESPS